MSLPPNGIASRAFSAKFRGLAAHFPFVKILMAAADKCQRLSTAGSQVAITGKKKIKTRINKLIPT
jgi:hypothetical protein